MNKDITGQFYRFYRPQLFKISRAISAGGVRCLVGINAIGKTYLADALMSDEFKKEFIGENVIHRVFLNFKDKPYPTVSQICKLFIEQTAKTIELKSVKKKEFNEFTFSQTMGEMVNNLKKDEKIAFIILDAQNILHLPESFFTCLTYLKIYSYNKLSFTFLSEPQILECSNQGADRFIQRFTDKKIDFLRTFDKKTSLADIENQSHLLKKDFSKYKSLILRYSKGFHGIIRTFCYLFQKYPGITNIRSLIKVAVNDKLCQFWVKEVLDSLPSRSLILLRGLVLHKRKYKDVKRNLYGKWLVNLGFITEKGQLRYHYLTPFLQNSAQEVQKNKQTIRVHKNQIFIRNDQVSMPDEELLVLLHLYRNKGKLVTHEEMGNVIWPNNIDDYSLWAIYQIIKRLKKRLSLYSVNPHIISSQRGKGYSLDLT